MEDFLPKIKWRPALKCWPESNYWGDADVDHNQIIGGKYPPRVSAPLVKTAQNRLIKANVLSYPNSTFRGKKAQKTKNWPNLLQTVKC